MEDAKGKNRITISENEIIKSITKLITECDCDELARIVGDIFGGNCFYETEDQYAFWPNENYAGEFDKQKSR